MRATPRSFVEELDFRTSMPHPGGPKAVITDFGVLTPAKGSNELTLTALFSGANVEDARAAVGWRLAVAPEIEAIAPPMDSELATLRALNDRTAEAHRRPVELPA